MKIFQDGFSKFHVEKMHCVMFFELGGLEWLGLAIVGMMLFQGGLESR